MLEYWPDLSHSKAVQLGQSVDFNINVSCTYVFYTAYEVYLLSNLVSSLRYYFVRHCNCLIGMKIYLWKGNRVTVVFLFEVALDSYYPSSFSCTFIVTTVVFYIQTLKITAYL